VPQLFNKLKYPGILVAPGGDQQPIDADLFAVGEAQQKMAVPASAGIRRVFSRFMTFGEDGTDATMIDNAEWLTKLNYIDFLRDVGRHFSVNRMLSMDSVKMRLEREQELSFIEFNYMCLQAYDFVELSRRTGCNSK
jgi:tyrosyl-tRNA synthetase